MKLGQLWEKKLVKLGQLWDERGQLWDNRGIYGKVFYNLLKYRNLPPFMVNHNQSERLL